jgi:hypothetical protein
MDDVAAVAPSALRGRHSAVLAEEAQRVADETRHIQTMLERLQIEHEAAPAR